MTISYHWLKEYVPFALSPEDLAEVLTHCGLEVESFSSFQSVTGGLKGVVVGEVLECIPHPDADKLKVTRVNIGEAEPLQIVCGAANVATGQKVAVATIGCTLYPISGDPLPIKKAKIRGVESRGMICAEDELGLGSNHDGIMILAPSLRPGTPCADVFGVTEDIVFEIGLTPNRTDAFSHIGVARDLAAALEIGYKTAIAYSKPQTGNYPVASTQEKIKITVEATEACKRYAGIVLENLTIGPSPDWIQHRLRAIGVKCINNVVDITNYVLHECGQPLHAFDLDRLTGNQLVIRMAREGEKIVTLDQQERTLHPADLVIGDANHPVCIAGILGGAESGVQTTTRQIFLESAWFNPQHIRQTVQRLGVKTDASAHFEKGCDPDQVIWALQRAADLMIQYCGARVSGEITDWYPQPIEKKQISISIEEISAIAGTSIPAKIIRRSLEKLDIVILTETNHQLLLEIPHFKVDVTRQADIAEEVLRLYGYNSIPIPARLRSSISLQGGMNPQQEENHISQYLASIGFREIWTNSIASSTWDSSESAQAERIMLLNSQTSTLDSLRTSMVYSGLEVILHNINRKQEELAFFELGKTYHREQNQFAQKQLLTLYLCGLRHTPNWITPSTETDFFHLKNTVEQILDRYPSENRTTTKIEDHPHWAWGISVYSGNRWLARYGKLSNNLLRSVDIKKTVWYAELNWDELLEIRKRSALQFRELPRFPSVERDLSMVLDEQTSFQQLEEIVRREGRKLMESVRLIDVYKGDKIEAGKKSYTLRFTLRDLEKTLTDAEIETVMNRLMKHLQQDLNAQIRTT